MLQIFVAIIALGLQIVATFLARPLKHLTDHKLWSVLMALNFFILLRRSLSIFEVVFHWTGESYESVAVTVGLAVSVFMLFVVLNLRKHAETEKQRLYHIAEATVFLAKELKAEKSLAYQLAVHFGRQRDLNDSSIPKERGSGGIGNIPN